MVIPGTDTQEYQAFVQAHRWTLMLDGQDQGRFMARWERAQDLPGFFYPIPWSGEDETGYAKPEEGCGNKPAYVVSLKTGCTCPDSSAHYYQAPGGWCKHRLALWLHHFRLQERARVRDAKRGRHPER